ncbi:MULTISPECIES: hypothetical protein [Actinomycetaceae]|uniref:Prepilin-type cleavage/methylation domain-containing protein n=1 Tax=Schaalia turicensis TaxID=131111 RepID=A0ABZ0RCU9_9ACTO|nr:MULTISPECIES: hypothetical protein [Actinotignum]MDK8609170.1 hypothetical protein [Actinomycetaceae bacterium UMB8041A]WPJ88981.1 hypothetical protein R0V15_08995 [Schaalia turicensis]MDE1655349.1 hypothetical protein [Actinotignum schaalii]MDK6905734.1 hypothetical protein [Actinotignum timonense]MDK8287461.1 hypothetical protein [Actinotignum sanguinis]
MDEEKAIGTERARGKRRGWLPLSETLSLISVVIAVAVLGLNIYDRHEAIKAEQFSQANQAFVQNKITAEEHRTDTGKTGRQITSSFHNASPNPVFDLTLALPAPLDGLKVSADHYHEFRQTSAGYEITFPTLPPKEKAEYVDTYGDSLFGDRPPLTVINENFRFCFTDVNGQRWLADHRGAQRISSTTQCIPDKNDDAA